MKIKFFAALIVAATTLTANYALALEVTDQVECIKNPADGHIICGPVVK